jgi:hypothetical protein
MGNEVAKIPNGIPAKTTSKDVYIAGTKLDQFVKSVLNRPIPQDDIRVNRMANNANYLPISFVETKLDEVFFGLWSIENFESRVIANEVVGSLELKVFHPVAQMWLTRVGVGAVVIQQDAWLRDERGELILDASKQKIKSKPKPSDVDAKITNTLVKDYPHLKAECIKNAAKSLGVMFGRDLNRKDADFYQSDVQAVVNSARMPYAKSDYFDALIAKTEREGAHVIDESREYFSFTKEQEERLSKIVFNG